MERRVALSRAYQLLPRIAFLDRIGAPVESGLERNKLPPRLRERPEMFVSTRANAAFTGEMARREGIGDFGWRAASSQLDEIGLVLFAKLRRSPTLLHALEVLCACANRETSTLEMWLEERGDDLFLCHRSPIEAGALGADELCKMRTALMISIARIFTELDWVPIECGFAVEGQVGPSIREELRDARILRSPDYGWMRLPRSILPRPPRAEPPVERRACAEADEEPSRDLSGLLVQLLRPYLPAGAPTLHAVAELAGISGRTLQRELARLGLSYRDVLLRVKLDVARELLERPDVKIIEVAHETGFSDPAHFSRFFRALSGVTPREYRATHLQDRG
jgi:AraC-like DNA-binding protein